MKRIIPNEALFVQWKHQFLILQPEAENKIWFI